MPLSEIVWTTPWGGLREVDVPPELWARVTDPPRRKDGNLDRRLTEVHQFRVAMDGIAFKKWEAGHVPE